MIAPFSASLAVLSILAVVPDPPLSWSPSGEWIAYTIATIPVDRTLGRFPLFPDEEERAETTAAPGDPGSLLTYRVWALRVEDGRAIEVAEGNGPMSSPSWSPDGHALAFGRVVEEDGVSPRRWEVVVAFGEDLDVVSRRELDAGSDRGDRLIAEPVCWEPGGSLLAVPDPQRVAIELIDIDRGETVRRIEGASLASFSPIGERLAFYRARGDRWELVEARTDAGPEADRTIDLADRADQAPVWTSDGQTILYLKLGPPTADGVQPRLYSHRVDDDGPVEVKQVESPSLPGEEILGAFLTVGDDGFDQYFAVQYSGRQSALGFHQGSHPIDRIHPFGGLGMLGAPILSPDGDRIAVRFGGPGPRSVPGLIDATTKVMSPLAPDDESRAAWVAALAEAAEPPPMQGERPTRLPFASELGGISPPSAAYARLAEQGTRLVDELDRGTASPGLTARPSLFFSYLRGDFDAADQALGRVSRADRTPDHALRLLGLRAQLSLARGRDAEAREIIEFVRDQHRGRVARVEADGSGGFAVSPEDSGTSSWPEQLWRQHRDRLESRPKDRPDAPPAEPEVPISPFGGPIPPGSIAPSSGGLNPGRVDIDNGLRSG